MNQQLEALRTAANVTGLAVAYVSGGHVSDVQLLGEDAGESLQRSTRWRVASLTKPVFVYGAMLLVKSGLLDLDRPLQFYLPHPYLDDQPYVPLMTARHAMSHTTGFPNWRDGHGLIAAFEPGTKFSYSSEGLTCLQVVAEHIVGMPMSTYLKTHVFTPLGMQHTQLQQEAAGELPPALRFLKGNLLANCALSLTTTIEDYARFMNAMLSADEVAGEMLQPQIAIRGIPNLYWGLGWGLQVTGNTTSFWHWGARSTPHALCFAMGIPTEQRAIVVFTNHSDGLYLSKQIVELWADGSPIPAFDWLLPARDWRPDGKAR